MNRSLAPLLLPLSSLVACGGGGPDAVLQSKDGRYRVVQVAEADWKADQARAEAESAFERFGDGIDLVYAHNDDMAHGANAAAAQKGQEGVRFVGIDAVPTIGREYLAAGTLDATIEYPTCAQEAIDLALLLCNGVPIAPESRRLLLGTRIWTRQNQTRGGQPLPAPGDFAIKTLQRQHEAVLTTEPATDEIFKIGVAQCTDDEPWRQAMREDLIAAAARYPQVELDYRSADDDTERQRDLVREFVQQGCHAILVSPKESLALAAACKEALAAGVHVVVVDRELGTDDYSVFVGGDNVQIGRAAAEQIKRLLPEGGTIFELQGLMTSSPAQERHRGFVEALGLEPVR